MTNDELLEIGMKIVAMLNEKDIENGDVINVLLSVTGAEICRAPSRRLACKLANIAAEGLKGYVEKFYKEPD